DTSALHDALPILVEKGVLGPGNMMLIDTTSGRLMRNEEVKAYYAAQHPYKEWAEGNSAHLKDFEAAELQEETTDIDTMCKAYGFTEEVIHTVILVMSDKGEEPVITIVF